MHHFAQQLLLGKVNHRRVRKLIFISLIWFQVYPYVLPTVRFLILMIFNSPLLGKLKQTHCSRVFKMHSQMACNCSRIKMNKPALANLLPFHDHL